MFAISDVWRKLLDKLKKKSYRSAYVGEHVRQGIAYQIRALRDQRDWKQGELACRLQKPQSVVCRLEDPNYGKVTIQTLLKVASVFDVALLVKFVDFPTFLRETRDVTSKSMEVDSFDEQSFAPQTSKLTSKTRPAVGVRFSMREDSIALSQINVPMSANASMIMQPEHVRSMIPNELAISVFRSGKIFSSTAGRA